MNIKELILHKWSITGYVQYSKVVRWRLGNLTKKVPIQYLWAMFSNLIARMYFGIHSKKFDIRPVFLYLQQVGSHTVVQCSVYFGSRRIGSKCSKYQLHPLAVQNSPLNRWASSLRSLLPRLLFTWSPRFCAVRHGNFSRSGFLTRML